MHPGPDDRRLFRQGILVHAKELGIQHLFGMRVQLDVVPVLQQPVAKLLVNLFRITAASVPVQEENPGKPATSELFRDPSRTSRVAFGATDNFLIKGIRTLRPAHFTVNRIKNLRLHHPVVCNCRDPCSRAVAHKHIRAGAAASVPGR